MLIAPALAQEYPMKPLRLMVPYPAGGDGGERSLHDGGASLAAREERARARQLRTTSGRAE